MCQIFEIKLGETFQKISSKLTLTLKSYRIIFGSDLLLYRHENFAYKEI